MAEPFKEFLNAALVREAAATLQRIDAGFPAKAFERAVIPNLGALELKARALCIADALAQFLPSDFATAAELLTQALAPVANSADSPMTDSAKGKKTSGMSGWILWPVGEYVSRRGVDHPEVALTYLHAMTQRFTAEFAIRPLLVAHEALVLSTLTGWVNDPSPHVRRLVSEGTRPRLPWGLQLKQFIANPSPCLPLLAALMDDESEYVRRSVANHLNDIAKDHPALVTEWVVQHLRDATAERKALLKHASRTLIKKGHPEMLAAWGTGAAFDGTIALKVTPRRLTLGESLSMQITLTSTASAPQELVVDYVVHHVKASGGTSPKVFKGWRITLAPGETRVLSKRHAIKPITTRRYYSGKHGLAIQLNGTAHADASFTLSVPE